MTRVRRAAALVCSWQQAALVIQNYRTHRRMPATPLVVELLDYCTEWRRMGDVLSAFPGVSRVVLRQLIATLQAQTFLERGNGTRHPEQLESWQAWSPEAALFHFATKDVKYDPQERVQEALVRKSVTTPPPAVVKRYRGRRHDRLPLGPDIPGLSDLLQRRRTWRRFAASSTLDLASLSTLLKLTWGVQGWAQTELGQCALKTSPSGGARHPTEVYLLARRVAGIASGCYYYDPDAHALVLLKRRLSSARLQAYLAGQDCYADAPAVFVMTSVFARLQWRYEFPRAYRVVLLDAGHLGQTFCLVATALGLAPFVTAALADSLIERDLGLDGVTESAIYACGVGRPPRGATWAPWPDTWKTPNLLPPKAGKGRTRI